MDHVSHVESSGLTLKHARFICAILTEYNSGSHLNKEGAFLPCSESYRCLAQIGDR